MVDKSEWQGKSGEAWAAEWRRTDRSLAKLTERLLQRLNEFRFREVADIGCGAGELSLAIARSRPEAFVTGVDVSPQLVETARERAVHLGNVEFELCDAANWSAAAGHAPDLLVSRHGVMFFDDPPSAFANLSGEARDGTSFMFSCFRAVSENPFFTEVGRLLPEAPPPVDPAAPGPFAFADRERVSHILHAGGWTDIAFEEFDFPMIAGAGSEPVEEAFSYFSRIGPAARGAAELQGEARLRFLDRVRDLCERKCHDGIVALPAAAWIVTARKAS